MRHIEIIQGNDYIGGRALAAVGNAWGNDIAAVRLIIWAISDCNNQTPIIDLIGTYTASTVNNIAAATVNVPRVETLKLKTGLRAYQFEFKGLTNDGGLVTLESGLLSVLKGGL